MQNEAYSALTGADGDDIEPGEVRNGLIHILSLGLTKTADSLIDPKLILSWLLNALGAPGAMIGVLVPVRESGALLPQLAMARHVEESPQRKLFWATGAIIQGLAALAMAVAALTLEGTTAGVVIVLLLAVLASARAASSVSYKDALARTIAKRRRGAVTGFASSAASVSVFLVGLVMASGLFSVAVGPIAAIIAAAGVAFILAGLMFMRLKEPSRSNEADDDSSLAGLVEPLFSDNQLRLFVATRAALAVTALAPPFIVMISAASGRTALDQLGPLVMASTAATVVASYVWGRLSDRSSRQTLMLSGALGAVVFFCLGAVGLNLGHLGGVLGSAAAVFAAQISYEGVRSGRKIHLTDMADDSFRARYTALSNTLIGFALLVGGLFGLVADWFGPSVVLLAFGVIAAVGAAMALGLDEVQRAEEA